MHNVLWEQPIRISGNCYLGQNQIKNPVTYGPKFVRLGDKAKNLISLVSRVFEAVFCFYWVQILNLFGVKHIQNQKG